jgi:hypothetical protein
VSTDPADTAPAGPEPCLSPEEESVLCLLRRWADEARGSGEPDVGRALGTALARAGAQRAAGSGGECYRLGGVSFVLGPDEEPGRVRVTFPGGAP